MPALLAPPEGIEAILVIPHEEVSTAAARAAMPAEVPLADAVHNVGAAAQLVLGIERSDLTLIERGLSDRLHQPHRSSPTRARARSSPPRRDLGAIGATISGAGPTVLVWSYWQSGAGSARGSSRSARDGQRSGGFRSRRRALGWSSLIRFRTRAPVVHPGTRLSM